jgi:hypothetical protein
MDPCYTLAKLEEALVHNYLELSEQFKLLDAFIPSYEAFIKLLIAAKPPFAGFPYVLRISHPDINQINVEFETVKEFVRTRLFKWDPTLKNRVRVFTCSRNTAELAYVMSFMLADDFVGFGEGHEFP